MAWLFAHPEAIILPILGYALTTMVLTILAVHRRHAITVYDLIRESKRVRAEYERSVEERYGKLADVDIIEEDTPPMRRAA